MSLSANYRTKSEVIDGVEVVKLFDDARTTEVMVAPSIGNIACRMLVNGKNALWTPFDDPAEMKSKGAMGGVPLLWPWANRIDQDAYYVDGKKYTLNSDLGNLHRDANGKPIHGLLRFSSHWQVIAIEAGKDAALVTSRLEFSKYPDLMAQFPFAHTIELTYRLAKGVLEVETLLQSLCASPMPVLLGLHPYYQVHDAPRDEWRIDVAARDRMTLSSQLIPTGELTPVELARPLPLEGVHLDDVFANLDGTAFTVQGKKEKVSITFGPKYTISVIYAPLDKHFVCFEPMTGPTNAFNLAQAGLYRELQSIPPGGEWRESFWISTSGF